MEDVEGGFPLVGRRPKAEHFYFPQPVDIGCDRMNCDWTAYVPLGATLADLQRKVASHKHVAA